MARVAGGRMITYRDGGRALIPRAPVLTNGGPSHEPEPPRHDLVSSGHPPLPPPVDAYSVTGTTASPPHLASLGQAFTFAQSHFPAGTGAVTISRRVLLAK